MRVPLAILILLLQLHFARSDEPAPQEAAENPNALVWGDAFSAISAIEDDSLVCMVISNDDPLLFDTPTGSPPPGSQLWCTPVFSMAIRQAYRQRPGLKDRMHLQSLAAGMPTLLTGGESRNQPARAIVAICDGHYRLLAFTVGIPDVTGLLTLIEDAQEVHSLAQMHRQSHSEIVASVIERSGARLNRMWRGALQEMLVSLGEDNIDEDVDVPNSVAQKQIGRLTLLWETYSPTYLADVRLRFGLTEAADRTRLVILEQHPEARRPWCEAMIPFLAGNDMLTLWKPLCESVWGFQPIVVEPEDSELLDWWDTQIKTDPVVFSLQPAMLQRRQPWPPVDSSGKTAKRGLGWKDVQQLVVEFPYRSIDSQQLFALLRARDLKAVDIQSPSTARYLFFEPKRKVAVVVRQGDPPGRFVGQLKRAK